MKARKSWIVGYAPTRRGVKPPEGDTWLRLARILYPQGSSLVLLELAFDLLNLLDSPRVSRSVGKDAADALLHRMVREKPPCVVALGRNTARLLGLGNLRFFEPRLVASSLVVVVPHPSGSCRLYNDERVRFAVWSVLNVARSLGSLPWFADLVSERKWSPRRSA